MISMKVGVIGIGNMGKNHVRIYSELKGVDDVYIYDKNPDQAYNVKEYGIVCNTLDELFSNVDAVSICVPTSLHYEMIKEAIRQEVHFLVEKPLASTVKEGEKLLKMIEKADLISGVGHIERFNPIVEEIMKISKNPVYIEIKRHNPSSSRIQDSSVVEDLMIHDIDIVFNVLTGAKNYRLFCGGGKDFSSVMILFNGTVVSLSASRIASKKIRSIYIEEEDYTVEGDFMNQEMYIYKKPAKYGMENEIYTQENIIEKVLINKVEPLKIELKTFVECIRKGKEFPVSMEQALFNLKVCEEIKREIL